MKSRALILAAGKGKRMKSERSKVLHEINGKSLIEYVVDALDVDAIERIAVIVSEQNFKEIKEVLGDRVDYVLQREQLGTGHAVLSSKNWLSGFVGNIVVVVGDAPFLDKKTVSELLTQFNIKEYACVLLSAIYEKPPAYGRIVRDGKGVLMKIVEEKDASQEEKSIKEVSSSHYCFDKAKLFNALKQIKNDNMQGEYYLPDTIEIFINNNELVEALPVKNPLITFGINSREDLILAEKLMKDI